MTSLPTFFGDEWDRFRRGISGLDPDASRVSRVLVNEYGVSIDREGTITIPGWDDVIHVRPAVATTREDWREYYRAEREHRAANLSQDVVDSIDRAVIRRAATESSQLPGWARAYGQVMTAIDNVQDFASTVSTLGRLLVWGGQALGDYVLPGASEELASVAARAAARETAVRVGADLAKLGLSDAAFVQAAARAAASRAFRSAILGFGARFALRAVPVLGWIILAGDLLNFANLMLATALPAYALLCDGPRAALASGVPAVVLKNIFCRRTWTNFHLNPFSRAARASVALRAMGRLPSISNLIEVAQTTDALFGIGLSIGALYGMVMESLFAAAGAGTGQTSRLNMDPLLTSLGLPALGRIQQMSPQERWTAQQAARALQAGVTLQSVNDVIDPELHMLTMTALAAAVPVVAEFFHGWDSAALMRELLPRAWSAPTYLSVNAEESDRGRGRVYDTVGRWPVDGAPRELTGEAYIQYFGPRIASAMRSYLAPRRNTMDALYYGAIVNQVTENLWVMIGEGADPLKWELTADSKLLTGMAVDGLWPHPRQDDRPVWPWWLALHERLEDRGGRLLEHEDLEQLAKLHGVDLVKLLGPEEPMPGSWRIWIDQLGSE